MRMGLPVGVMLEVMDAVEWQRWMEFHALDPITQDRDDLRAAMLASTIAQVHGVRCKPSDFIPSFGPPPDREPMTDEQMMNMAKRITAVMKQRK